MAQNLSFSVNLQPFRDHREIKGHLQKLTPSIQRSLLSLSDHIPDLFIFIRHDYDPQQSPVPTSYLILNSTSSQVSSSYDVDLPSTLLNKGELGRFFEFQPVNDPDVNQSLDWVEYIGEVLKAESFLDTYSCYVPHQFGEHSVQQTGDFFETMMRLDRRAMIQITLQPFLDQQRQNHLVKAINEVVRHLQANGSHLPPHILQQYQSYQRDYATNRLFSYSIQVLTQHQGDAIVLRDALSHQAGQAFYPSPSYQPLVKKGDLGFTEGLQAIQTLTLATHTQHPAWQSQSFLQRPIKQALKSPKKLNSQDALLAASLPGEDNSLDLDKLLSRIDFNQSIQQSLSGSSPPNLLGSSANHTVPHDGDVVLGGRASALSNIPKNPTPICFTDLKPLHRLVTLQEFSGFLQLAAPVAVQHNSSQTGTMTGLPDRLTIQQVIQQYGHLITEDTFVAGVDEQGEPVISDFSKIAHRLIAGVPGSGKTNFINAIIYQFLYANPNRTIDLADFQAGMHYQLIADHHTGIRMVTQLSDFAHLLGELWQEHESKREQMRDHRVRSLKDLQQQYGITHPRRLLIIDEAFYIQHADRETKGIIDRHLNALAALGRITDTHIVYCSQRPTTEVIPKSISDNMDERIVFRVQSGASLQLLDADIAANLPVDPRGRAIYRGSDTSLKLIATPFVPDDIWAHPIR